MVKNLQCWRPGFDPWVWKIPWRRKWQPTSVFLPGKSHGQRRGAWWAIVHGVAELHMTEHLTPHQHLMIWQIQALSQGWFGGFWTRNLWLYFGWLWLTWRSFQFSHSVVSDSLQPHGLQPARLPCPSPTPRACSNSYLSSQFFASGGQRTGVSASTLVLPMNIQDWFTLGLTGLISLQSKGLSEYSPTL